MTVELEVLAWGDRERSRAARPITGMRVAAKRLRRGARAVWLFIALAVSVVAAVGAAIGTFDVRRDVRHRRDEQIFRLISHAERSASHIASQLQEDGTPHELTAIA